ncbi:MAG: hypothetical protein QOE90_1167 [Thermoplasmata archaeon]|nr:hypothetical protein [Thermoplasmata archaeon]
MLDCDGPPCHFADASPLPGLWTLEPNITGVGGTLTAPGWWKVAYRSSLPLTASAS